MTNGSRLAKGKSNDASNVIHSLDRVCCARVGSGQPTSRELIGSVNTSTFIRTKPLCGKAR